MAKNGESWICLTYTGPERAWSCHRSAGRSGNRSNARSRGSGYGGGSGCWGAGDAHTVVRILLDVAAGRPDARVPRDEIRRAEAAKDFGYVITGVVYRRHVPGRTRCHGTVARRRRRGRDGGRQGQVGSVSIVDADAVVVTDPQAQAVACEGRVPREELFLGHVAVLGEHRVAVVIGLRQVVIGTRGGDAGLDRRRREVGHGGVGGRHVGRRRRNGGVGGRRGPIERESRLGLCAHAHVPAVVEAAAVGSQTGIP